MYSFDHNIYYLMHTPVLSVEVYFCRHTSSWLGTDLEAYQIEAGPWLPTLKKKKIIC